MFFDRDQNARREREIAYRNQLKQQIEMKNSKILQKNQRPSSNQPQTFSLLKNIEIEEQNRKKRQQNFYSDLQNQIELQKQQKKRRKQEEARRQLEQEQKIKKDLEMLRQRVETEKLQEQKKKGPQKQQNNNELVNNKKPNQNNQNPKNSKRISLQQNKPSLSNSNFQGDQNIFQQNINPQSNFHSRLKTSQSERDQNQLALDTFQSTNDKRKPYDLSSMPTYVNRVENEAFNFLPQRKYMNSYFQELLGEKKKFQQEASSLSELNKILYHEKSKAGKIESRGLGELRKLQMMLDEKGANYMAGFSNSRSSNQFDSLRKITIPTFLNSRVSMKNTGWRKLD